MKTYATLFSLALVSLFLATNSFARGLISGKEEPFPKNWCMKEEWCSPQQHELWAKFSVANAPALDIPTVISGSCFHGGSNVDPNHEHHAGFVFTNWADHNQVFGRFSYFAESNPYINFDVKTAENKWFEKDDHKLLKHEDYWVASMGTELTPVHLWYRQGSDGKIYLAYFIGSSGLMRFALCEMEAHKN